MRPPPRPLSDVRSSLFPKAQEEVGVGAGHMLLDCAERYAHATGDLELCDAVQMIVAEDNANHFGKFVKGRDQNLEHFPTLQDAIGGKNSLDEDRRSTRLNYST